MRYFPIKIVSATLFLALIPDARAAVNIVPQSRSAAQIKPQSARIEAQIAGDSGFAQVKETWTFSNAAKENFEAELVCRAPKNALMTGFAYYYRGERVVARVVEKTRAANIYSIFNPVNVPMAQRRDPAIAEMLARNLLKVRVGPVDAGKPLIIELTYSQPLETLGKTQALPLQLRDEAAVKLESFAFQAQGASAVAALSLGKGGADFKASDFALPATATLEFAAPAQQAMLQSDGKSGYFAAVLSESQWKTRDKWAGASDVVSKVLDGNRVLVAGKFENQSPAKVVGMAPQQAATAARLWWMALQIETLESNPKNYARVMELSNASNLPSAFSSWLAIPSSERRAMEERIKPDDIWEQRQQVGKLGSALALWKALGKTNTPQYRSMRADFEKRRAASKDYYVSQTLAQREETYVYTLRETLKNYARTTDNLSGAKLASFEIQLQRLGAKDYHQEVKQARFTLHERRLAAQILHAAIQGKSANYASLPESRRDEFVAELANRSYDLRSKNPAQSRRLRALAETLATRWQISGTVANAIYNREYRLVGDQILRAQAAYKNAILKGEENTPQGKKLARNLAELTARTEFFGHDGLNLGDEIGKAYAQQQLEQRAAAPDAAKIAQLQANVARLARYSGFSTASIEDAKKRGWDKDSYWSLARLWAREGLDNGYETPRAQKLKAEWRALHSATDTYYFTQAEGEVLNKIAQPTIDVYLNQITEPNADDAKIAQLADELKALEARSVYNKETFSRGVLDPANSFWRRQQALSAKIRDEARETAPDKSRLDALALKLGQLAATSQQDYIYQRFWLDNKEGKGRGTAEQYGEIRAQRMIVQSQIEGAKSRFAAAKTDSLAARAAYDDQIAELRQRENQLRVRMGDPLIAVQAPADARHVLAITPDGTLMPLRFDVLSGEWQARFDVPTYVNAGDYKIQIIVVFASGARQQLTMHIGVDLTNPGGVAASKREGDGVLISLETDAQTQRVTAFTPWNTRVELKRDDSGVFSSHVALPAEFAGGKLRFIVTDKAHNRTEITLDLSDDNAAN